jgi:SAM-dependent methyltransferase
MSANLLCPACHSREAKLVETVSLEALALAWSREKCHGDVGDYKTIYEYLKTDLECAEVEFWQCRDCGLEFARPMRSWQADHYPIEEHYLGFDHQVALSYLSSRSRLRVLDVGCADGQFLERGVALGHEMVGIDFAREDVEAARTRGLNAQVADVNEISGMFAGKPAFDVICLFQIIEHLNNPDGIFSQLNEIAMPHSRLIVGCPSDLRYTRSFKHQQRIERSDFWDYPPQHTLRWNQKALRVFLLRHGWQIEDVIYEPLMIKDAAAHLGGIDSMYGVEPVKLRRRFNTLKWMLRLSGPKMFGNMTGIRLLVRACRMNVNGNSDTDGLSVSTQV